MIDSSVLLQTEETSSRMASYFWGHNSELSGGLRDRKHTKVEFRRFSVFCPRARTDTPDSPATRRGQCRPRVCKPPVGAGDGQPGLSSCPAVRRLPGPSLRKLSWFVPTERPARGRWPGMDPRARVPRTSRRPNAGVLCPNACSLPGVQGKAGPSHRADKLSLVSPGDTSS